MEKFDSRGIEEVNNKPLPITQHISYGLTLLSFGTLLPLVATSYMLKTLSKIAGYEVRKKLRHGGYII